MNDEFIKVKMLIGDENFEILSNKKIVLIGLGGVGGSAFEALIRTGFKNITVIDYDKIELSNLNRQLLSNLNNINKYKVDEAKKKGSNINNNINITAYNTKLNSNNIADLISLDTDYIIDACDDVSAKIDIIKYSIKHNIKLISCMGTANKLDPSLLKITNIWDTKYDKLSKIIRKKLKEECISNKITVVASDEKQLNIKELGSLYTVTNYAGILCASYIINSIINNVYNNNN